MVQISQGGPNDYEGAVQRGVRRMGGRAQRSEVLSIQVSSEEGAKESAGDRGDKRVPSNQKMYLLPTIHEGTEWPGWRRQPRGTAKVREEGF